MTTSYLSRALAALLPAIVLPFTPGMTCDDECTTQGDSTASNATPVVLRIVNATQAPIYLDPDRGGLCSDAPLNLKVIDPGGATLDTYEFFCGGDATCTEIKKPGFGQCLPCPVPFVRIIPAGATFETTWDGTYFSHTAIAASCVEHEVDEEGDNRNTEEIECVDRLAAATGRHKVEVRAFTSCMLDGQPCACTSTDADGTCGITAGSVPIPASDLTGELVQEVELDVPSSDLVVVTFGGS